MRHQLPASAIICSEYQKLLEASAGARGTWSKLRAETSWTPLVPKERVDKLLRLQAKYAKAYSRLQKHVQTCLRCQPASKIA